MREFLLFCESFYFYIFNYYILILFHFNLVLCFCICFTHLIIYLNLVRVGGPSWYIAVRASICGLSWSRYGPSWQWSELAMVRDGGEAPV